MCCGSHEGDMHPIYTFEGFLCHTCETTKSGRERESIMARSALALN